SRAVFAIRRKVPRKDGGVASRDYQWIAVSVAFTNIQGSALPKDVRAPGDRLICLYSVVRGYLVVEKTIYA
ncbi:MAG TPA: hypothetical protein VJ723_04810, partial [Candidatus Angelobacter sp.]|nr:hypothetical protein [Candidatus Angelobacter sp.]